MFFIKDTGGTLNTSLVAYWKLNDLLDSIGSNHLAQSGNNNVSPETNPVTFNLGGKGIGYASFVRTTTSIYQALRGAQVATSRVTDFSWAGWVNIAGTETIADIFHNGDATIANNFENNGWTIGLGNSGVPADNGKLRTTSNGLATNNHTGLINLSDWAFIIVTVTSGNLWTTYKNGVSQSALTGAATRTPTSNVEFGISSLWAAVYASQLPYSGSIQEVGVWNKVLSAQEISDLYNSNNGQAVLTPVAIAATNVLSISFSANWDAVDGASGYKIDVATDAGFTAFVPGFNNLDVGNVVTKSITGLTPDTQYYYRVRYYNLSGSATTISNTISQSTSIIAPPTNLAVVRDLIGAHLTWDASTDVAVTSYNIYRNGILFSNVATTSFLDSSANILLQYSYYITALITSDESQPSNTITSNFSIPLSATADANIFTFTWSAVGGTDKYLVERRNINSQTWLQVANTIYTSFIDAVAPGNYQYRIKATSQLYGDSGYSYANIGSFSGSNDLSSEVISERYSVRFGDEIIFNEFSFGQPEDAYSQLLQYLPRFIT